MKIICTAAEKERFIEGVVYDVNEKCPFDCTKYLNCRECLEEIIEWEIVESDT